MWAILGLLAALEAGFMYTYLFPRGLPFLLSLILVAVGVAFMLTGVMKGTEA